MCSLLTGNGSVQAVYGAFARFRARHCLGAVPTSFPHGQSAGSQPEAAAVSMLQHVSATAAALDSPTTSGADDIAPGGIKISPSQMSDLASLASAEAQQGSGDRSHPIPSPHSPPTPSSLDLPLLPCPENCTDCGALQARMYFDIDNVNKHALKCMLIHIINSIAAEPFCSYNRHFCSNCVKLSES